MKNKVILLIAAVSGALVVALGAVGAHALEQTLIGNNRLETYQLAVRYHSFHTLAFLALGMIQTIFRSRYILYSFYLMLSGTIFFSGSLYLLSITDQSIYAFTTPAGGILLIISWLVFFYAIYNGKWRIIDLE